MARVPEDPPLLTAQFHTVVGCPCCGADVVVAVDWKMGGKVKVSASLGRPRWCNSARNNNHTTKNDNAITGLTPYEGALVCTGFFTRPRASGGPSR